MSNGKGKPYTFGELPIEYVRPVGDAMMALNTQMATLIHLLFVEDHKSESDAPEVKALRDEIVADQAHTASVLAAAETMANKLSGQLRKLNKDLKN